MKRLKADKSIWLIVLIILLIVFAAIFLYFQLKSDPIAEDLQAGKQIKILLMVHDQFDLVYSELICIDGTTGQSVMFNIPVNTGYWNSRQSRFRKISLLYRCENSSKYHEAVENLSGTDIPYQIEISLDQVSDLIDFLGGIDLFLADPLSAEFENEKRLLPAGSFTLYGYQALFYLKTTFPGESAGEYIKRKQKLVKQLLHRSGELSSQIMKVKSFKTFLTFFDTNFDKDSIVTLLSSFEHLDNELFQTHRIRGRYQKYDGVSLYLPDREGLLFKEQVRQIFKALRDESFIKRELLSLNLEVLNGSGLNMQAARTMDYFQSYGYNVIRTGNASKDNYEQTIVYVRSKTFMRAAKRIADIIKCTKIVLAQTDEKLGENPWNGADIRLLLGRDYDNFRCHK